MTENAASNTTFWESQLDCLKQSLQAIGEVCKARSLDPQLSGNLTGVSSQLSAPASLPSQSLDLAEALAIIPQARASVSLLSAVGYLGRQDEDGQASPIHSALDEIEMLMGKELRSAPSAQVYGLYIIIDPEVTGGRDPVEVARGALRGGAKMLQLRDKLREKGQILPLARTLKELCDEHDALLIINDHPDLASVVGSHGLHVGQGDLPVAEVRRILAPGQIIGRSNHLVEEAVESQAQGADHVAVGAMYPTTTKASIVSRAPAGPETLRRVKEAVSVPVVAIGGINEENVGPVVEAGADAICITSAVGLAQDPEEASRRLVERIRQAGGRA